MDYTLINSEYLDSIAGDDPQIIVEIVDMFRVQVSEIHKEMMLLYSRKDYLLLGMLAHKAKSSVAIMGMNDLANMLKSLETAAKEGKEIEKYESYINRFGNETSLALAELDNLISTRLKQS